MKIKIVKYVKCLIVNNGSLVVHPNLHQFIKYLVPPKDNDVSLSIY